MPRTSEFNSTYNLAQRLLQDHNVQRVAARVQNTINETSLVEEPEVIEHICEEQEESKHDFTELPNYESIKHFEEPLSDEEFLKIIIERLNQLDDVTYKILKDELLPKHRKPSFRDYLRFRIIETILLQESAQ